MSKTLAVFAAGLLWFSLLISWSSFVDPDAFYHAHIALLLWQHGPILSFPWLDLTTLGASFADHHFLFHVLEAPFVAAFGWATGARVTAVVLASVFLATCHACLRWLGIRAPLAWVTVLAFTEPLLIRLLLGKATPLALALFVFGLAAAWKRKPFLAMLAAFLFALSHGGWIFLIGSVALLAVGETIHRMVVDGENIRTAIRASGWRETFAAVVGAALGTVVHPNFPENVSFLWIQVVKIGLGTPYAHVMLGNEWLPVGAPAIMSSFAPWLILLAAGLAGLALAGYATLDRPRARAVTAFALPVAVCLALTLKSRRNAEYLAATLVLWIPWMWTMVDPARFSSVFREAFSGTMRRIVPVALVLAFSAVFVNGIIETVQALHRDTYPDNAYRDAMKPVTDRANPGDRVFHSDWDEFPILFSIDDRLKYIAGLDPTFLYEASSTLSDAYRDVTWGLTSSTADDAWNLIHDRLHSRFVFIDTRDHAKLLESIKRDGRYVPLAETDDAATFELRTP